MGATHSRDNNLHVWTDDDTDELNQLREKIEGRKQIKRALGSEIFKIMKDQTVYFRILPNRELLNTLHRLTDNFFDSGDCIYVRCSIDGDVLWTKHFSLKKDFRSFEQNLVIEHKLNNY